MILKLLCSCYIHGFTAVIRFGTLFTYKVNSTLKSGNSTIFRKLFEWIISFLWLYFLSLCINKCVFRPSNWSLKIWEKSLFQRSIQLAFPFFTDVFLFLFFSLRFVQTTLQLTKYCLNILRWFIDNTRHSVFSSFLFLSLCFKGWVLQLSPSCLRFWNEPLFYNLFRLTLSYLLFLSLYFGW